MNSSEQLRKLEKIKPFGHSKAKKKKNMPDFAHFPRPGQSDPCGIVLGLLIYVQRLKRVGGQGWSGGYW